ncbi:hypothetical protein PMI25_003610 [Pseudomonas sp. GM30]|nr:hypothetical protein PMI25_003610 [Pseudomonas sp. GM30]
MSYSTGSIYSQYFDSLSCSENFIFLYLLNVRAHAAIILSDGDFHTLSAHQAFLCGRAYQSAGHRAYDSCDNAAAPATNCATSNATNNGSRTRSYGCFCSLNFDRP